MSRSRYLGNGQEGFPGRVEIGSPVLGEAVAEQLVTEHGERERKRKQNGHEGQDRAHRAQQRAYEIAERAPVPEKSFATVKRKIMLHKWLTKCQTEASACQCSSSTSTAFAFNSVRVPLTWSL